jgi:hypothetical protein
MQLFDITGTNYFSWLSDKKKNLREWPHSEHMQSCRPLDFTQPYAFLNCTLSRINIAGGGGTTASQTTGAKLLHMKQLQNFFHNQRWIIRLLSRTPEWANCQKDCITFYITERIITSNPTGFVWNVVKSPGDINSYSSGFKPAISRLCLSLSTYDIATFQAVKHEENPTAHCKIH